MNRLSFFSGVNVPNPVGYLEYLFLRHPGQVSGRTTEQVRLLDTYEYTFARKGLSLRLEEKAMVVSPPSVQPQESLEIKNSWYGRWRLLPIWSGTVSTWNIAFSRDRGPEIIGQLVRFSGEFFLCLPVGEGETNPLVGTLLKDQWLPVEASWFRSFLNSRKSSGFLSTLSSSANVESGNFNQGVLVLLRTVLQEARLYESGILSDCEPEPLHQYRVLIRKARSLVSLSSPFLTREWVLTLKPLLSQLHTRTSRLRDLDVALENLPGSSNIIRTQGGDPTFLEDYLKSERRKEAKQAKSWFNSSEYTEVWIEIEYLISGVDSPSIEFQDGAAKILQNGRKGFLRRLKALEEFHEDEMIHELRISVKKLRYVQEFFLVRSRDQVTENAFDNLKNVQELLGKFQDVCTEIDRFSQMRTVKTLSDAVRTYPFGYLVGKLDSEKAHLKNQVLSALKEVN